MHKKAPHVDFNTGLDLLLNSNEELTFFHDPASMKATLGPSRLCDIKIAWSVPMGEPESITFHKSSPLLPFFGHVHQKMKANGLIQRYQNLWFLKDCEKQTQTTDGLSTYKTFSLFFALICGAILSLIIFILEIAHLRLRSPSRLFR